MDRRRAAVGYLFILAGAGLVLAGIVGELRGRGEAVTYQRVELTPGSPGFFELESRFPVERLVRYSVEGEGDLYVAVFRGQDGRIHRALVYPPRPPGDELDAIRHEIWQKAAAAIREHTDPQALFIAWWDNGQRVQLLTGRDAWASKPPAGVLPPRDQAFLAELAGGTARDGRLERLARWLTAPAEAGLSALTTAIDAGRPVYLLVTVDDLAHLRVLTALSGRELAFDGRIFPFSSGNVHGAVPAVQAWVREGNGEGYLVQELPGQRIVVWRAGAEAARSLLGRLLPLSSSVGWPLPGLRLVYRSTWGGYLSIYRVTGDREA